MLKKRILSGCLLALISLVVIWVDQPIAWLTLAMAVVVALALNEFYNAVTVYLKSQPFKALGIFWGMLIVISPHLQIESILPFLLGSFSLTSLIYLLTLKDRTDAFPRWAWTLSGVIYIGLLASFWVALRELPMGREWVLWTLILTSATDTMAFFIGSRFGKQKMAPSISPNKSWQGAVGGAVFSIIVAPIFADLMDLPINMFIAMLLGLLVSVAGQTGDIAESLFKRNMHCKDSGNLIPGHGGIMDRLDSLLFTGIVVYYYVIWFIQ
ncbi:phosphatidate cytidylyltransferase [Dehalococcoides mccartyi]|uniref:Phosphatidate cytidylyltransferase n=2 Tax=Dehalococcoides mccartyi TaxID=61435 RepID=A0A328EL93_9CHLR|nr:phosphatidate cytidylyltransferase [Dehalococcoides mccartyi]OBW62990.1 MAG: phosphatidate cytidylyltransferase [Dehalococcoides mccartyi]RAL69400.1 Phosphatidate cytidylyltransferase [Dehalococcoides mccartyi]BAS31425.1 phosphatidate cytidylyltransferase [Dehalococcoides mccartyi IBARAKI]CAI82540.1 phosphatidate cytidylyltransferase [Dehalococcoides mccartyi CBDB1]